MSSFEDENFSECKEEYIQEKNQELTYQQSQTINENPTATTLETINIVESNHIVKITEENRNSTKQIENTNAGLANVHSNTSNIDLPKSNLPQVSSVPGKCTDDVEQWQKENNYPQKNAASNIDIVKLHNNGQKNVCDNILIQPAYQSSNNYVNANIPLSTELSLPSLPQGVSSNLDDSLTEMQNSTKQPTTDTSVIYYNSLIKSSTAGVIASPNMVRKSSDGSVSLPRRVSFPKSDNELVTGYLEPANPWEHVCMVKSISEIAELYVTSCLKHNTKPLQCILDHLKVVDLTEQLRQPLLSLKSIELAPSDCEALEEVLKRVQYKSIDISDCKLNEVAASALFEIIEYYEATNELDISSNSSGMTHRGWLSCTYMISHSQELQVLNAEGNPITKLSAENLGNALNTSNLHTLKLEHCGLKGAPLSGLCYKLWHNKILKELWIAYNDLDCSDADTIAEMLKVNHYLELIDISNNNIGDEGLHHIVMSLIMQSKELERRTTFQRAAAIDDDESMSPYETSAPVNLCDNTHSGECGLNDETMATSKNESDVETDVKCKPNLRTIDEKCRTVDDEEAKNVAIKFEPEPRPTGSSFKPPLISTVGSTIEEVDPDEDTDDTVRTNTLKTALQSSGGGQSMLDKLLSMNSESSSEDGVSNISTDTLAACCSEDTSLISDDVFDIGANAIASTTITTSTTFVKYPTDTDSEQSEGTAETPSLMYNTAITPTCVVKVSQQTSLKDADLGNEKKVMSILAADTNVVLIDQPAISSKCHAPTNEQSSGQSSSVNNYTINNIINNNGDNNNVNVTLVPVQTSSSVQRTIQDSQCVFEEKADESNCCTQTVVGELRDNVDHSNVPQAHAASKALDVNKNTKLGEDFDDTHSTDSAFESASEGDISRHLPEEFTRLSASLESTRLDDIAKEFSIETATIASESNECLITAANHPTPSSTPTPHKLSYTQISTPLAERAGMDAKVVGVACLSASLTSSETAIPPTIQVEVGGLQDTPELSDNTLRDFREKIPKVTIARDSITQKYKVNSIMSTSPSQTPPPPSTSPGGVSSGLRRTESSCAFLTQSTRNRSQSTDSLCSDNSLDGSIGSGDLNFSSSTQLNEKLTKNDTLTRQQRQLESTHEASSRAPGGLKALALWNNNLSKEAGLYISNLLAETVSLELLNIGKNCLTNDFVTSIKDSLTNNKTLTTLGLQSAQLSAKGIETLTSIMTFGGNSTLQRIDIRGNKVEVESLTKIAEVLKSNTTVTQIDIDDEPKRLSVGSEAHLDYARVLEVVRSRCACNEENKPLEKASINPMAKTRGGYNMGSRKISLTCHSRPIVDTSNPVVMAAMSNNKLDVKRKPGTRLRSPVPSPTTISPSSSPNRGSRFQVFRVAEVSPLTSPNVQKQTGGGLASTKAMSSSSVFIPSVSTQVENDATYTGVTSTSLPTSCSLPSMATISSSTQSIKRLSVSPRSRFLVRKIYEDPSVPLASRTVPPITPPINPPPTPILRNAEEVAQITKEASMGKPQEEFEQPKVVSYPTITSTSSINTQQQPQNLTTDSCATPFSNVGEVPGTTQEIDQSTKETTSTTVKETIAGNDHTISVSKNKSIAIQPSPSILSTLSTLSSSSSTSETSSSSSVMSSSSSSSSTSPASNIDSSDSSSSSVQSKHSLCPHIDPHDLTVSGQCPIAVFGDNDITLTKNTVNEAFVSAAVAVARDNIDGSAPSDENVAPPATHQQRVRKVSRIANPTAVDKLLTLFHNPFQRSSSPEPRSITGVSVSHLSQNLSDQPTAEHQHQSVSNNSIMPLRKQSPPSWTKLGTDILTAAGTNNVDLANSVATTAAAVVTEQSRSFLDAASKQFRDFSKQVFRQNLSFGNESVTTAATTTLTSSTVNNPSSGDVIGAVELSDLSGVTSNSTVDNSSSNVASVTFSTTVQTTSSIECNVATLPTDVKQEIKENISPEHTINEETLHSLQKLYGSTTPASTQADCKYDSDGFGPKDTPSSFENKK